MAKTKVSQFDATAANNTDINSVNVAEGCPPSGINNAIREMASLLKKQEVGTDAMTSPDIDGGTIDGATIGASSATTGAFTNLTASGTLNVTGETTLATHLNMGDGDIIKLGASSDLQIYHDGSNSYIDEQGTGNLLIRGTEIQLKASDGTAYAEFNDGGASNLRFSGDLKLATSSSGVTVVGDIANSSGDFTLDVDGDITLDADGQQIFLKNGGTHFGTLLTNATPQHFYIDCALQDGDLIFRGNDGGSNITALTLDMSDAGTAIFNHDAKFNDAQMVRFGSSQDSDIAHYSDGQFALRNTDSQGIVFYTGSTPTEHMRINADGIVTKPLQSAFSAIATGQTDLAASSVLQIGFAGSERFDQNSDFNTSNSTFTAPVTGKYQFNVGIRVKAIDTGAGYVLIRLNTSNANYDHIFDSDEFSSDLDFSFFAFSILADMDSADTCIVQFFQNGGTQQTDIDGASYFSGYLVA